MISARTAAAPPAPALDLDLDLPRSEAAAPRTGCPPTLTRPPLLILTVLLLLPACELARDDDTPPPPMTPAPPPPPPDAIVTRAPALTVTRLRLRAERAADGRALPGPRLIVDLDLTHAGRHAPAALGLRTRCAVGNHVLQHDDRVQVADPPPAALAVPLFGGAWLAHLPQACEIVVRTEPRSDTGAHPRDVGTFCSDAGGVTAGPCGARVPPRGHPVPPAPPVGLDELSARRAGGRLWVVATVTRWQDGPPPGRATVQAACGPDDAGMVGETWALPPTPVGVGHRLLASLPDPGPRPCAVALRVDDAASARLEVGAKD